MSHKAFMAGAFASAALRIISNPAAVRRLLRLLFAAMLASSVAATAAFAHAHLVKATPAADSTVSGSLSELTLAFTQALALAFTGVEITTADGDAVPAEKPTLDPANPAVLHVALDQALKPGAYKVSWHAVSVDTHRTEGSYTLTVTP